VNGKAEDGASPDPKAALEREGGRPEARTRRHEDPSSSSLFELSKRESFLILMSVGWDCQADRRVGAIIHHLEWEHRSSALAVKLTRLRQGG
jgi:hypothetical protein